MDDRVEEIRLRFAADELTPYFYAHLASAYIAVVAATRGEEPPLPLPEPTHREGKSEPYADAPPWERYTWRAGDLKVSVRIEPRCSRHGVHGSDMRWTLRGVPGGELRGHAAEDARTGERWAALQLGNLDEDLRGATVEVFRAALGAAKTRGQCVVRDGSR